MHLHQAAAEALLLCEAALGLSEKTQMFYPKECGDIMGNSHLMKIGIEFIHILGIECEFNEDYSNWIKKLRMGSVFLAGKARRSKQKDIRISSPLEVSGFTPTEKHWM